VEENDRLKDVTVGFNVPVPATIAPTTEEEVEVLQE